jgi:mono/diheme cytochrome c family protein
MMCIKNIIRRIVSAVALPLAVGVSSTGAVPSNGDRLPHYEIENIPIPEHIVLEVGGMDFTDDGRLMIATHGRGDVWALRDGEWRRFAHGLHEPLGLVATGPAQVVVGQRPEMTRITDTTGDGVADLYETITDAWNYSGHMYEYTFGPVADRDGNLWGALGYWFIAGESLLDPIYADGDIPLLLRRPTRPPFPNPEPQYRGWVFKVTPEGEFVPWASGVRSPNGLAVNSEGDVFVADNQGEYVGANPILHVTRGTFLGYPLPLLWDKNFEGDPTTTPLDQLDAMRKPEALIAPYGEMGQSTAQLVWDETGGKFGPFAGQLFIADHTRSMLMRATLEKIQGEYQGAMYPFLGGFKSGNNRIAFSPDGHLYVGQTARGWRAEGGEPFGLQRVVWNGTIPMEILEMNLTAEGFDLSFTHPVDRENAADPRNYSLRHYHYKYHREYGSPKVDEKEVELSTVLVSEDGRRVSLFLPELIDRKVYELRLNEIRSAGGEPVLNPVAYYTLSNLLEGTPIAVVTRRSGDRSTEAPAAQADPPDQVALQAKSDHPLFNVGRSVYAANCASCHGQTGDGGVAPALAKSDWIPSSKHSVIRIILQGIRGEELIMPPFSWLNDEEIAAVATYLRQEWHDESAVEPSLVETIRRETASRTALWTKSELEQIVE